MTNTSERPFAKADEESLELYRIGNKHRLECIDLLRKNGPIRFDDNDILTAEDLEKVYQDNLKLQNEWPERQRRILEVAEMANDPCDKCGHIKGDHLYRTWDDKKWHNECEHCGCKFINTGEYIVNLGVLYYDNEVQARAKGMSEFVKEQNK